jgi:hypothetical protein
LGWLQGWLGGMAQENTLVALKQLVMDKAEAGIKIGVPRPGRQLKQGV